MQNNETVDLEDLTALDRGDNLPDTDDSAKDIVRDDKGRFAKQDEAETEDKSEDADEADTATQAEDDEHDEDEDAGKDIKSLKSSRAKALQQRDAERQARLALEAELARLKAQAAPAQQQQEDPVAKLNEQIDSLYEQVEEARADGDVKKAAQLQRQLDTARAEIMRHDAAQIAQRTTSAVSINARYDAMLDVLEARYEELNPKSENFDDALTADLSQTIDAFTKAGLNPVDALRKAVRLTFREDPFAAPAPAKTEAAPAKPEKPAPKKPDVAKAVETEKRQPPDTSSRGVNKDSTQINAAALSDEDFAKLPEATKRRLRGDDI